MNRMLGPIWKKAVVVTNMLRPILNDAPVVAKRLQAILDDYALSIQKRAKSLFETAKIRFAGVPAQTRIQFANVWKKKPQLKKAVWWALGIIFVLQLYFVRELIAAEMLFGLGFAALLFLGGVIYVLGTLGERGLAWSEARARVLAQSARRGLTMAEELSRRSLRNPRSESAQ